MVNYLSGGRIQGSSTSPLTITDDLTTNKGNWVANGTGNAYNAGNDYVDFKQVSPDASSGSERDLVYIDVQHSDYLNGDNLNDTAFTVKCKVRISAIEETGGGENRAYFGFYSDTAWGGTAQDFFYLQVFGKDNADPTLVLGYGNNSTFESAPNKNGTAFTAEPLINTNYYITFTKTGGDTYKIRVTTSSDYTGGQEMTATASSITGLRYFGWKGRGDTQDNGGNTQGYFDDISITSGTADEKASITDAPVGTRYEETDTRKIFRCKDGGYDSGLGSTSDWTVALNLSTDTSTATPTNFPTVSWSADGTVAAGSTGIYMGAAGSGTGAGAQIFPANSDFTISTWIRPSIYDTYCVLRGNDDPSVVLYVAGGGAAVEFFVYKEGGTGSSYKSGGEVSFTFSAGSWYHIVGTYDESNGYVKCYVNNVILVLY